MRADRFSHRGRASLPTSLVCTCDGANGRCLICETERETELWSDVGLDGMRPMPAPARTPEDHAYHARAGRWIATAWALVWFFLVALLKACGARTLTP